MSSKGKIFLIGGVGVAVIGLVLFLTAVSWYDEAVSLETSTQAQARDNQNEYDAFWKKVKEVAQVPEAYKEDFKDLLVSETSAKFGEGGSKAAFQWFKDREINFDAEQYKKIQNVIESGRDDFKRAQTTLLDKQRKYKLHLSTFAGSFWAHRWDMPHPVAGALAPSKDLDGDGILTVLDYPIVTSKKTNAAFEAGEDEALNIFE